jgi:hypothetical protein
VSYVVAALIILLDADGGNPRQALTYAPPATRSEYQYYVCPAWAADAGSLRVAIPPADPHAQPPQRSTV